MNQSSQNSPSTDACQKAAELLQRLQEGEESPEARASLNELLLQHEAARRFIAAQLHDEALLTVELKVLQAARAYQSSEHKNTGDLAAPCSPSFSAKPRASEADSAGSVSAAVGGAAGVRRSASRPAKNHGQTGLGQTGLGWLKYGSSFALGAVVVFALLPFVPSRFVQPGFATQAGTIGESSSRQEIEPPGIETSFVAHVVNHDGDVWNPHSESMLMAGAGLRAGETIILAGGIAQVDFEEGLELHVEGPAELDIRPDGTPVLKYGRATVKTEPASQEQLLASPMADMYFEPNANVGVALFGSELHVHAFEGDVVVHQKRSDGDPVTISSGTAKHLDVAHAAKTRVTRFPLVREMFASQLSIAADQLHIPDSYPALVKRLQPAAYWRFEQVQGETSSNEIADSYTLQLKGGARIAEQGSGNHALEFGYGSRSGSAWVEEPLDALGGEDYSIELWVKPSHFHRGAVLSLSKRSTQADEAEKHGLLIELQGSFLSGHTQGNEMRLLHRSPVGISGGTECFSSCQYKVREWQHLVATKSGSMLRLYADGEVVSRGTVDRPLEENLFFILGQLYSFDSVRPFVGQMDELAVYPLALDQEQIKQHYRAVKQPDGQ